MSDQQFHLEYEAGNGYPASCEIRVYQTSEGRIIVVAMDEDTGPSVTNNVEIIATELRKRKIWWDYFVEHYRRPPFWREHEDGTFDYVTFHWDNLRASRPEWKHSTRAEIEQLIGERVS